MSLGSLTICVCLFTMYLPVCVCRCPVCYHDTAIHDTEIRATSEAVCRMAESVEAVVGHLVADWLLLPDANSRKIRERRKWLGIFLERSVDSGKIPSSWEEAIVTKFAEQWSTLHPEMDAPATLKRIVIQLRCNKNKLNKANKEKMHQQFLATRKVTEEEKSKQVFAVMQARAKRKATKPVHAPRQAKAKRKAELAQQPPAAELAKQPQVPTAAAASTPTRTPPTTPPPPTRSSAFGMFLLTSGLISANIRFRRCTNDVVPT